MSYLFGKFGASSIGNTSGVTGTVNRGIVFAGGNNVTLSQSVNASSATLTISAAAQTIQTQNLHNVTLSGNTAGVMAHISSGTLTLAGGNNVTLSQNGNAVTISAGAGGAGGGIALANSQATFTNGTVNLSATGALTIASTTGSSFQFSVPQTSSLSATGAFSISTNGATVSMGMPAFSAGVSNIGNTAGNTGTASNQVVFAGGNNITLSQSADAGGNTITISAGAGGGAQTMIFYQNMDRGTSAALQVPNASLILQRLNQENDLFVANITANTFLMNMSANLTTSHSTNFTISLSIGIYSDNATNLSLINSASLSMSQVGTSNASTNFNGARWLSLVSSQWSSAPAFSQGGDYVFGVAMRISNATLPMSYVGQSYMNSAMRSGTFGAAAVANATLAGGNFWNAVYTSSTTALPVTIASNSVIRTGASANFMPHIILNNRYSGTF